MNKIAYVNGQFLPENEATVSIFDRGFLFGDGIYEAVSVLESKLVDLAPHLARLDRSLREVGLRTSYSHEQITTILKALVTKNDMHEGLLYFQITRGVAPRAFNFPPENIDSSFVGFTLPMALLERTEANKGVSVITVPELRWKRRDIKSIGLLPQCLGKQAATEQDCYEALMVEDGMITEGTSSSSYLIKNNTVITRPLSNDILPGVTRRALLALAEKDNIQIEERQFSVEEAYDADEFCLTAASNFVMPVVQIDNKTIGDGKPGALTKRLRHLYIEEALKTAV